MYAWIFIILMFLCLVVAGVKYDRYVPTFLILVRRKRLNLWYLSIGIFLVFFSLVILSEEPQLIDQWGFPVHNRLKFAVTFIGGLLTIVSAFLERPDKKIDNNGSTNRKICIACGKIFEDGLEGMMTCPKCGGKIEGISGIMDRHPELFQKINRNS